MISQKTKQIAKSAPKLDSYLLFDLGSKEKFAIDIKSVVEVRPMTDLTVQPASFDYALGFFSWRNSITPVFSLSKILKLSEIATTEPPKFLMLSLSGKVFGFKISKPYKIVSSEDLLELSNTNGGFIANQPDRLISSVVSYDKTSELVQILSSEILFKFLDQNASA